jgi:hypothetical protein
VGVWLGNVSPSYGSDLEGVGRRRILNIPAKPGEPGLLRSPLGVAVVGVLVVLVGEAGVETTVMAGQTGAGWTIGAAGAGTGACMAAGAGRVGVGASRGGSHICESGRAGMFKFIFGFIFWNGIFVLVV